MERISFKIVGGFDIQIIHVGYFLQKRWRCRSTTSDSSEKNEVEYYCWAGYY